MKKISNLLRHEKLKGIDKLSALFELELIDKVCRDLGERGKPEEEP
jgi:hypothetical protein